MLHSLRIYILLSLLPLLTACFGQHALIKKESFDAIQQCLDHQQQLLSQQEQFQTIFAQLNETLAKPLQVEGPVVRLMQKNSATCQTESIAPAIEPKTDISNKQLVGEIEQAYLAELGLTLKARIDTGATTSSIDARNIQVFERDGEQWVRFNMLNPETEQMIQFEKSLVRKVKINQANSSVAEARPVIELQVAIGKVSQLAEFTLSDRSHLGYQVLVGRNILRDVMVVDVSQSLLVPLPPISDTNE